MSDSKICLISGDCRARLLWQWATTTLWRDVITECQWSTLNCALDSVLCRSEGSVSQSDVAMERTKDSTTRSLTAADVEMWLDDNVDWLCDYLQRRRSILRRTASLSRYTVPTQCRSESTLSPWHSRKHTISVDAVCEQTAMTSSTSRIASSPHHYHRLQNQQQQQVQRGVTLPTRTTDHNTQTSSPSSNLFSVPVPHVPCVPVKSQCQSQFKPVYRNFREHRTSIEQHITAVDVRHDVTEPQRQLQEAPATTFCQIQDAYDSRWICRSYQRDVVGKFWLVCLILLPLHAVSITVL